MDKAASCSTSSSESSFNMSTSVDIDAVERLLQHMRCNEIRSIPLHEVLELLSLTPRRFNRNPFSAGEEEEEGQCGSPSSSSISSGVSFISPPKYKQSPAEDLPSPPGNRESLEANADRIRRPVKSSRVIYPSDDVEVEIDLSKMCFDDLEDKFAAVDSVEETLRNINLQPEKAAKEEKAASETPEKTNIDFLSDNLDALNFNIGLDGKKEVGRKFGVKQRIGKTPAKFKESTDPVSSSPAMKEVPVFTKPPDVPTYFPSPPPSFPFRPEAPSSAMDTGVNTPDLNSFEAKTGVFNVPEMHFGVNLDPPTVRISPGRAKRPVLRRRGKAAFVSSSSSSSQQPSSAPLFTQAEVENVVPANVETKKAAASVRNSALEDELDQLRKAGKEFFNSEEYGRALDSFTKALEKAPKHWSLRTTVLANRAAALMMLDRFPEVVLDCDRVCSIDPTNVKILCRKGRALLKQGHIREAEAAFTKVLDTPLSTTNNVDPEVLRADARIGIKSVHIASGLLTRLRTTDCAGDAHSMLPISEELLTHCPFLHEALVLRAKAFTLAHLWRDCKRFIEEAVGGAHFTLMAGHSHYRAPQAIVVESLEWREDSGRLSANYFSVVNFMLFMGAPLARYYLSALKNIDHCKSHPSRVMSIIEVLLNDLATAVQADISWSWATEEKQKMKELVDNKRNGDSLFKEGKYSECLRFYTHALKVVRHL